MIHDTAIIDNNVTIGNGTNIWAFSHILYNCTIGDNCNIGQNVIVGPNVTIGNGCKIQDNVVIYDGVTICNNVFIGPSVTFTNIKTPRAFISRKNNYIKTIVHDGVSIGANSTIVCGVELFDYCMIGAGSVVTKDVPMYFLVAGNPATYLSRVCECGNRLRFGHCSSCNKQYCFT